MALDPWGTPYRMVMQKIRKPDTLSILVREDGTDTRGWKDSMEYLLNGLLPSDKIDNETDNQAELQRQMTTLDGLQGVVMA